MLITHETQFIAYGLFLLAALIVFIRTQKILGRNRKYQKQLKKEAEKYANMRAPLRTAQDYRNQTNLFDPSMQQEELVSNDVTIISQFAGSAEYCWDGRYLSVFAGKKIASFDGEYLSRFAGPKLYFWQSGALSQFAGPKLYSVSNGVVSQFAGKALYRYDQGGISQFAGPKLYSINGKVHVPEAIIICVAEGLV